MTELLRRLRVNAAAAPDAPAFSDDDGAIGAGALWRRAGALARRVAGLGDPIGILLPNSIEWVVADLACKWSGKTAVPLPDFFSPAQLAHVAMDAGVAAVLTDAALAPRGAALAPVTLCAAAGDAAPPAIAESWRTIVYSSGSSGAPKGVLLGDGQLAHSARALAAATNAVAGDVYLSAMPLSLLLEQLAAIHLPVTVGGRCVLSAKLALAALQGDAAALADAAEAARPSVLSLVPLLLGGWTQALRARGKRAPGSLRLVAVGGAPVPAGLAQAAWGVGIPVHEGYGLSECCAVVALNRPGARAEGTVGRPLDGVRVEIAGGEIVVSGPTVMERYLHGPAPGGRWATGDLGEIDAGGNLVVRGRKDAVIRTALGRNIHPEWIEAMIRLDPRVRRCVLAGDGLPWPVALVEPTPAGRAALEAPGAADAVVAMLTRDAPDYARPRRVAVLAEGALGDPALVTANGRPRRSLIAARFASHVDGGAADGALRPGARKQA